MTPVTITRARSSFDKRDPIRHIMSSLMGPSPNRRLTCPICSPVVRHCRCGRVLEHRRAGLSVRSRRPGDSRTTVQDGSRTGTDSGCRGRSGEVINRAVQADRQRFETFDSWIEHLLLNLARTRLGNSRAMGRLNLGMSSRFTRSLYVRANAPEDVRIPLPFHIAPHANFL